MDRRKLLRIGSKLDLTPRDVRSLRFHKLKDNWLYPVLGSLALTASACWGFVLGRFRGADKPARPEYLGYPYSSKYYGDFGGHYDIYSIFGAVVAAGALTVGLLSRRYSREHFGKYKALFIFTIALVSIILFVSIFWHTYQGVPQETYSLATRYGVYSREGELGGNP